MSHLEPTYLRYIYDGLIKGSIHPENAAELPDGFIGLYEEAFDERTSVKERQKLLNHFAIWALLKKEVSVAFVAEVLEEKEEDVLDFISTHSAWFNSPESGKYQLYHERLKVYLLQKLSDSEINSLIVKFITVLSRFYEKLKNHEELDKKDNLIVFLDNHGRFLTIYYLISPNYDKLNELISYVTDDLIISLKGKILADSKLNDHELLIGLVAKSDIEFYDNKLLINYIEIVQNEFRSLLNISNIDELVYAISVNNEQIVVWLLNKYAQLYSNDENKIQNILDKIEKYKLNFDLKDNFVFLDKLKSLLPFEGRLRNTLRIDLSVENLYFINYANANGWMISLDEKIIEKENKIFIQDYKNTERYTLVDIYNFWNELYNKIFDGNKWLINELSGETQFLEDNFEFSEFGGSLHFAAKVGYVCAAVDPLYDWVKIKEKIRVKFENIEIFSNYFKSYSNLNVKEYQTKDDFLILAYKIERGLLIDDEVIIDRFENYFPQAITLNDFLVADALKKIVRGLIQGNDASRIFSLYKRLFTRIIKRSIAPYQDLTTLIDFIDINISIPSVILLEILSSFSSAINDDEDDFLIKESLVKLEKALANKQFCLDESASLDNLIVMTDFFEINCAKNFRILGEKCFYPLYVLLKNNFVCEFENLKSNNKIEFSISYFNRFNLIVKHLDLDVFSDIASHVKSEKQVHIEENIDSRKLIVFAKLLNELLQSDNANNILSDLKYKFTESFYENWAKHDCLILLASYYKSQNDPDYWIEAEWIRDDQMYELDYFRKQEIDKIVGMTQEEAGKAFEQKIKNLNFNEVFINKQNFYEGIKLIKAERKYATKETIIFRYLAPYLNMYILLNHNNYETKTNRNKDIFEYLVMMNLSTSPLLTLVGSNN